MSNYSALKTTINANIKTNGNQEITGAIMNSVLTQVVNSLGAGYQFMGVATTSTDPGTPDQRVFYIARESGTYTNFGDIQIDKFEIGVLRWDGEWSKQRVKIGEDIELFFTTTSTTYNDDGSIYFGEIRVQNKVSNSLITYEINDTISPLDVATTTYFVLTEAGSVVAKPIAQLLYTDTILIIRSTQGVITGGVLYADYINKKKTNVERTICPNWEMGAYSTSGTLANSWYGKRYWRSGFIKCHGVESFVFNTQTSGLKYRLNTYDADYNFLGTAGYTTITNGLVISLSENAYYFTLSITGSTTGDINKPDISLTGRFDDGCFAFAGYPSDSGYQKLIIPVNIANPNASDNESGSLQDEEEIKEDYGLIVLPTQYTPDGHPTRLIIYCHGAGVNYASSVTRFPTADLLPEYWLSEGYAVMDIEGNPFNNTDEHGYSPQAIQSYLAAYDWVTRYYNIARDGVFLGGRSMGGGMCFEILQSRIPVIAACPVAPVCNELWWWEYMNSDRREFCAEKMGFTGSITWTNENPMSSGEWDYLQSNFDKLVKYSPFWRGIECLPNKTTLFSVGNVGSNDDNDDEASLYNDLHFKVKSPIKMFAAKDDTTVNYKRNCKLMYQMLLNSAQICEMRYFPTGNHHFELTNYILANYTNSYGEVLSNVPLVYVEMLQFWRRYELNN